MFKAAGLLGLILASGMMGIMKTFSLKERINLLEEYLMVLLKIKSKISYFKEPLVTLFGSFGYEENDLSPTKMLLENVQIKLKTTDEDINTIWDEEIDAAYSKSHLTERDINILKLPGKYIGQTDFNNQQAQFSYTEERIREQIIEAKENYKVKGKLYNRIGFFIGGIIAIIFI